ncbi:alkaline phosphatase family protein [Angustibacter sp. McL0619]|uniref:alkaline phosphatase family protein n=1 Tax=Angustibacter sp. McL0619 TaxID=3415676 RepID=UPI003CE7FB1D
MRRQLAFSAVLALLVSAAGVQAAAGSPPGHQAAAKHGKPPQITNLVVIYQENHSFDNLFGSWGKVGGQQVDGLASATAQHATQVAQDGTAYGCLLQDDVNLTSPPLDGWCHDPAHSVPSSSFANGPFSIDDFIGPADTTCPAPGVFAPNGVLKGTGLPGGCTRDLVHRFYQEQYQINGGMQNRYVTASDSFGLTMGHYDTTSLPIYRYLHSKAAPNYVVADRFFQGAFGGSFLNHQYLIAARAPVDTSGGAFGGAAHSVIDSNGMPTSYLPLYTAGPGVVDGQLTQVCDNGAPTDFSQACGNYAVNTVQPASPPFGNGAKIPLIDDTQYPNIGDRMSAAHISWAWYSGGWADAEAGHPGPLFQFHHQPFNYFAAYAPGQPGRAHLKDETQFIKAAKRGTLPTVSFVKPYGAENEHPGYASEPNGSDHLVDLLRAVEKGPQAKHTLVVVTYDEFGGQWDHVSPPGMGSTVGVHDAFGPSTRIPALVLSAAFTRSGVDHTVYDTTSIMASIERRLGLRPVSERDARVADLAPALAVGGLRSP